MYEGEHYRQVYDAAKDYLAMYDLLETAKTDLQQSYLTETLDISLRCLQRTIQNTTEGSGDVPPM